MMLEDGCFRSAGDALAWLITASAQAAVLIVVVLALRAALGRWLTPGWRAALWLLIALRLTVPLAIASPWALPDLGRRSATLTPVPPPIAAAPLVTVTYGPVPGVNPARNVAPLPITKVAKRPAPINVAVIVWLAGVALLLGRQTVASIRLHRAIGRMRPVGDDVVRLAADCARAIGLRRRVRMVETDRLRSPAVCGILRPTILLPADVRETLSDAELRLVLLHELVHVRRDDALVDAIARLVRALHWFNPLVWIGVAAFRSDRELSCDAAVLRGIGDGERDAYGACVIRVVEHISQLRPHPLALGVFGTRRQLRRRIHMIAHATPPARLRLVRAALGAITVAAIGIAAAVGAPAETSQPAAAADLPPSTEAVDAAKASLATPLGVALKPSGTPFREVVEQIRGLSPASLFVNWTALEGAGIDKNVPITFELRPEVKLGKALSVLCDAAGGGVARLAFSLDDDVITISTEEDLQQNVETRTYDVRDLLVGIPGGAIAPTTDAVQQQASTAPAEAPASRGERVAQLIGLIEGAIERGTWKTDQGLIGSIQELGGQLIVTHTPEVHARIATLLARLRESRAVQVHVEARFMAADSDFVPTLLGRAMDPARGDSIFLDDAAVADLLRRVAVGDRATTLTAPKILLFNGQSASVNVSTQQAYIADYAMTRSPAGERRFEPRIDAAESGVSMEVQATLSADRKYVTLTLGPRTTRLIALHSVPFAGDPASGLNVQVPEVETTALRTTVNVPDGGTLLMGGQLISDERPTPDGKATTRAVPRQLLVLVKAKVIAPEAIDNK